MSQVDQEKNEKMIEIEVMNIEELRNDYMLKLRQIAALKNTLITAETKGEFHRKKCQRLQKSHEKLKTEIEELKSQKNSKKQADSSSQQNFERRRYYEEKIQMLQSQLRKQSNDSESKEKLNQLEILLIDLKQKNKHQEREKIYLAQKCEKYQLTIEELNEKVKNQQKKIVQFNTKKIRMTVEEDDCKTKLGKLQTKYYADTNQYKAKLDAAENQIKNMQNQLRDTPKEDKVSNKKIENQLQQEKRRLQRQIDGLNNNLKDSNEKLNKKINALENDLEKAKRTERNLRNQIQRQAEKQIEPIKESGLQLDLSPVKEYKLQQNNKSLSVDASFEGNVNYPFTMSKAVSMLNRIEEKITDPNQKILFFNTLLAYADNRIEDVLNVKREIQPINYE